MDIPLVVNPSLLYPDPTAGPWHLTFYWANVDGYSRLIGMDIHGWSGGGLGPLNGDVEVLTAGMVKGLAIGALANLALAGERDALVLDASIPLATAMLGTEAKTVGRPRLAMDGPEGLRRTAEIYRAGGTRPVMAVAEAMHLSRSAAAKRVQRARGLGLL